MARIAGLFMLSALALLASASLGDAEMTAEGASFPEWKLVDHTGKERSSAEFAAAEEFPFPLLSDTERKLAVAVGAADKPDQWSSLRMTTWIRRSMRARS